MNYLLCLVEEEEMEDKARVERAAFYLSALTMVVSSLISLKFINSRTELISCPLHFTERIISLLGKF